jgi:APA family basic amino acid/polyamine antiporter
VAKIQNVLTGTKVLVVISFVVFGFLLGKGNWQHFSMPAVRTSVSPLYLQFGISLFFIYMSYSGWNAATYVAEELRQPARTLPIALTIGTVLVTAIYVALNMVFIYGAPLET